MTRVNYERVPILTDKVIKQTLDEVLNPTNIGVFEKLVMASSKMFTLGTTGYFPGFAIRNIFVDQIAAAAQTRNGYVPVLDQLKTIVKIIQGGKQSAEAVYLEEYLILGGERQTFMGMIDLEPDDVLSKLRGERSGLKLVADAIGKGVGILGIPSKYSEIFTRAQEYINARKAGKTQLVALEEAGRASAPFHHRGRFGGSSMLKVWVRSLPFFGASLQVLDQTTRTLQTREGRARMGFVSLALTAAMASSFWYLFKNSTQKQKDQYLDLEPEELAKTIWIPSRDGEKLIQAGRIPENLSLFGVMLNMALADIILNADYTVGDYIAGGTAWLPSQFDIEDPKRSIFSVIPQIFKPAVLVASGMKDYPKVLPLENESLKHLPSELRFHKKTSSFAKGAGRTWLAQKMDLSPIKIDYLLTGYLGRTVQLFTGKPDAFNLFFREYYFTNGRRIADFYEKKKEIEENFNGLKFEIKQLDAGISKASQSERMVIKSKIREKEIALEKMEDTYESTLNISKAIKEYRHLDLLEEKEKAEALRLEILSEIKNFTGD